MSRTTTTEEAAVRAVIEGYTDAMRDKDVAKTLAQYDPEIVQFLLAPPLRYAGALDGSDLQRWFDSFRGPIGLERRDLVLTVTGELACAHMLTHMSGERTDEPATDLWLRETQILRKRDGAWKLWHLHESVPFDMHGSERALTDLKP